MGGFIRLEVSSTVGDWVTGTVVVMVIASGRFVSVKQTRKNQLMHYVSQSIFFTVIIMI